MNFLKPKKGLKGTEPLAAAPQSAQLPPLPTDHELYSELPNLPEAPETSGLPEIELPEPLKGLEGFDRTGSGEEGERGDQREFGEEGAEGEAGKNEAEGSKETETATPLLPNWPEIGKPFGKQPEEKLPEEPEMPDLKLEEEPQAEIGLPNIPAELPELKPFKPEPGQKGEFGEGLISHGGSHYLKVYDFRAVMDGFDGIIKTQKKHHNLTEIRKEENQHYEQVNMLFEDLQRKLMLIDRTLFE